MRRQGVELQGGSALTSSTALYPQGIPTATVGGLQRRHQQQRDGANPTPVATPPAAVTKPTTAVDKQMTLAECKAALANLTAAVEEAQRREAKANALLKAREEADALVEQQLRRGRQHLIKLNVGGRVFQVPIANLQAAEGSFFEVIQRGDVPLDRDDDGCIFIDRDPDTFRILLNYMRGYKNIPNLTMGFAHKILCDAEFYQMEELAEAMRQFVLGTSPAAAHQFSSSGAGINADRTRFRAVYNVCAIGDRLLLSGRHSISILIKRAEYVGLGVISEDCSSFDSEFHRVRNCCVYYMTGITYTNFPHHKKEEPSEKFGVGDVVTIVIDMQNHVVEFRVKGTVRCYSCASASRLRFAAVIKHDSELSICDSFTEAPTEFQVADLNAAHNNNDHHQRV